MSISAGVANGKMKVGPFKKADLEKSYFDGETVHFNPKRRRCKFCDKVLSIYNLNNFCFAHMSQGLKMEQEEEAERRFKQYQKNKKAANLKNRKKKRSH